MTLKEQNPGRSDQVESQEEVEQQQPHTQKQQKADQRLSWQVAW